MEANKHNDENNENETEVDYYGYVCKHKLL